ncbi:MAG: internalin N-terminal domain-containing protein [Bacilli bacterium]|nr:internalin N-terminal domain-containing protein [Bacilli bacterium]
MKKIVVVILIMILSLLCNTSSSFSTVKADYCDIPTAQSELPQPCN